MRAPLLRAAVLVHPAWRLVRHVVDAAQHALVCQVGLLEHAAQVCHALAQPRVRVVVQRAVLGLAELLLLALVLGKLAVRLARVGLLVLGRRLVQLLLQPVHHVLPPRPQPRQHGAVPLLDGPRPPLPLLVLRRPQLVVVPHQLHRPHQAVYLRLLAHDLLLQRAPLLLLAPHLLDLRQPLPQQPQLVRLLQRQLVRRLDPLLRALAAVDLVHHVRVVAVQQPPQLLRQPLLPHRLHPTLLLVPPRPQRVLPALERFAHRHLLRLHRGHRLRRAVRPRLLQDGLQLLAHRHLVLVRLLLLLRLHRLRLRLRVLHVTVALDGHPQPAHAEGVRVQGQPTLLAHHLHAPTHPLPVLRPHLVRRLPDRHAHTILRPNLSHIRTSRRFGRRSHLRARQRQHPRRRHQLGRLLHDPPAC
mmetsp:Transcript_3902/g.12385  ORF Transcript_3902/g.12385 Transcript_3902/m.12385 type:complete len:414 (-) Transcript_3902:112-1353(-)